MRSVRIALVAGLTLVAIAIGLTLLQSPMSVAGISKIRAQAEEFIVRTDHGASYCQAHEVLPQGTSAIRIWLAAIAGPRVSVVVSSGGRPITSGERDSNWIGGSVTIPVKPLARTVSGVTVCVSFRLRDETVIVEGNSTPATVAAHDGRRALRGRIWIEYLYLRPGTRSWASLAPEIMRHMGFGRAAAGAWIVYLALLLLTAVTALTSNLVLKEFL